ncbi:MAG: FAD-dependent monooxygenase [Candidatus Limnocylindria bacterium]
MAIERHRAVSPVPRARFVNSRTMEIFRALGVEAAVRALAVAEEKVSLVIWAPSVTAEEVRRVTIETLGGPSGEPLSPAPGLTTSQDVLDPVLLRAVQESGNCEVRFDCRLSAIEQHDDEVFATYVEEKTGKVVSLRSRYVVAADGARSTARELLGVPMEGPANLGHTVNIHFKADLSLALRGRGVNLAFILNPKEPGLLLNIDGERSWTAQALYSPAAGQRPEDYTEDRCRAVVRTQVGDPELAVEIIGTAPFAMAARVAARFAQGRVFLVGDAAHEMPPAGGFGMNTGVQAAHNLGWKLAAVLGGWAGEGLLRTYEEERRPVARWITDQALRNLASVGRAADGRATSERPAIPLGRGEFFRERGMVWGAMYRGSAVVPDGSEPPTVENPVTDYVPCATPGCRAPHIWLDRSEGRRSTLDLWGPHFTLLTNAGGSAWISAVERIERTASLPLRAVECGDPAWADAYGVGPAGAVLVRPDGYVAWRSAAVRDNAMEELARALGAVLDRPDLSTIAVA